MSMSYPIWTQNHSSQIQEPLEVKKGGVGFVGHLDADEFIEITVKSYRCAVGNFQVLIKQPALPSSTPAPKIAVNT